METTKIVSKRIPRDKTQIILLGIAMVMNIMVITHLLAKDKTPEEIKEMRIVLPEGNVNKYYITVERIKDGDTLVCDIKTGFNVTMDDNEIRLYRINTPEISRKKPENQSDAEKAETAKGLASKAHLEKLLKDKVVVWVPIRMKTRYEYKRGAYGRWLGELYVDGKNINDLMVEAGHAEYKDY